MGFFGRKKINIQEAHRAEKGGHWVGHAAEASRDWQSHVTKEKGQSSLTSSKIKRHVVAKALKVKEKSWLRVTKF